VCQKKLLAGFELTLLDTADEGSSLFIVEAKSRPIGILGVTNFDSTVVTHLYCYTAAFMCE
jgi:hypothetical protein